MDSNEIKVGGRALALVGRNRVEVVVMGRDGDKWKVGSLRNGRTFVTTRLEPLAAAQHAAVEPATSPAAAPKPSRAKNKVSLLDAAAAILEASPEPLGLGAVLEEAKKRRLWKPGAGKTPVQTLFSAVYREIKEKGDAARFVKAGRGRFTVKR